MALNTIDGRLVNNGTPAAPNLIVAVSGIQVLNTTREVQYVRGSGGAVVVTAAPRIERGSRPGQELVLFGTNDTDVVILQNGNGLALNGLCMLKENASLYLVWDGANWAEVSRNDL